MKKNGTMTTKVWSVKKQMIYFFLEIGNTCITENIKNKEKPNVPLTIKLTWHKLIKLIIDVYRHNIQKLEKQPFIGYLLL